MLKLDLRPGESVQIGAYATITLEKKSGQVASLAISADKSIPISRQSRPSPAQIAAEGGITGRP